MKDATSTPGARVLALAAAHVGKMKETGPNQGPPVVAFAGGRQEAWCAHMVATLYRTVRPLPGDIAPTLKQHNPIARCQTMWERLVEAGWNLVDDAELQPGDIGFMNERGDSDAGKGWHVFLVANTAGPLVQCISGNWGDNVARHHLDLRKDGHRIVGFARVPAE